MLPWPSPSCAFHRCPRSRSPGACRRRGRWSPGRTLSITATTRRSRGLCAGSAPIMSSPPHPPPPPPPPTPPPPTLLRRRGRAPPAPPADGEQPRHRQGTIRRIRLRCSGCLVCPAPVPAPGDRRSRAFRWQSARWPRDEIYEGIRATPYGAADAGGGRLPRSPRPPGRSGLGAEPPLHLAEGIFLRGQRRAPGQRWHGKVLPRQRRAAGRRGDEPFRSYSDDRLGRPEAEIDDMKPWPTAATRCSPTPRAGFNGSCGSLAARGMRAARPDVLGRLRPG